MKLRWNISIFVLYLSFVSAGFTETLEKDGRYWKATIEKEFKVSSSGLLKIEDIEGDINVEGWNQNKVSIVEIRRMDIYSKEEAERATSDEEIGYLQSGNTIYINGDKFKRRWIQSDFEIKVPVQFNCELETEGGDIEISSVMGEITVSTGGGDIDVENAGGPLKLITGGGDVDVNKSQKAATVKTGGGDVDLNDIGGEVEIITGGGDIDVANVKGSAGITTGGGDVDVSNCLGELDIKTGGGDIEVSRLNASLTIQTGGGDIDLNDIGGNSRIITGGGDVNGETLTGSVNIQTGGGEISLYNIQGALDLTTGGGDVYVQITLKDYSIDHHVFIETGAGDIVLELPAKMPASIRAMIELKKYYWEDHDISSDFPLSIITDENNGRKVIRAEGDINGGGDPVKLYTKGGDIYIRKH